MARPRRYPANVESLSKRCSKCAEERFLTQYHQDNNSSDGRASTCGPCRSAHWKEKYKEKGARLERYKKRKEAQEENIANVFAIKNIGGKKCTDCAQIKPIGSFQKKHTSSDGKKSKCKECANKTYREWQPKRDKISSKKWNIKKNYGLTWEEYSGLLESQKGNCAICECDMSKVKQGPCIDHCHKTGVIRGLLCAWCNRGLGLFKDNKKSLLGAMVYISRWEGKNDR